MTRRRNPARAPLDGTLVVSTALLAGLGVVMNYSATAPLAMGDPLPPLAVRHAAGVLAALVAGIAAYRLPLSAWRRLALPLWLVTVIALALASLAGLEANGARRWLAVPGLPLSIQPSEFARFATVLAVAAALASSLEDRSRGALRPVAWLVAAPVGLLLLQPDFGGAVLLVATVALVVFAGGIPLRTLLVPAALCCAGAVAYVLVRPYAFARLRGFLDPWQTAHSEGFQLIQSFVAFGRGGSFGVGLGDGRQKLFYLPEAHTDFILSIVAEELGLVGVLVVLGAFTAFAIAGLRIARRAREPFALLAATGLTGCVVLPAALNAGVVMGLLPTTGLTLPFLSHGSNAMLCSALAVAALLRIGAREVPPEPARVRGASPRGLARS